MSLGALILGAGIALVAVTAPSEASPTLGISFDLVRGEGAELCPDRDALATQVAKRLAQSRGSPRTPVAERVAITIEQKGSGYLATVSAIGFDGGIRRLVDQNQDCAGLAEALTLTLTMIADGRPLSTAKQPDEPVAARPSRPWEIGFGALGSTGIQGSSSLGITLNMVWHPWPQVAAGLTALWMPNRSIERAPGQVNVSVQAGVANVCWGVLPFGGQVFPAICGLFGAGALYGEGEKYEGARSAWRPWMAAGGSLNVGMRLYQRLSLAAFAGRLFSLRDERFTIDRIGQVYESSHPGWIGGLGLQVRIP
jgi:hypothetical protein